MSLGYLIGACGGLTPDAEGSAVTVMHRNARGKELVRLVNAQAEIEGRSHKAVILHSGDSVCGYWFFSDRWEEGSIFKTKSFLNCEMLDLTSSIIQGHTNISQGRTKDFNRYLS